MPERAPAIIQDIVPYIPPDYESSVGILLVSSHEAQKNLVVAQAAFSHILRNQLWADAKIWFDPRTGVLFDDEREIPDTIRTVVSARSRFKLQEEFITWCSENISGFSRSTFWRRHSLIDMLCEAGMDFNEAVRVITAGRLWTVAQLTLETILEFAPDHTVTGYNEEATERLFDVLRKRVSLAELPPDERLDAVKQAVVEYIEEKKIPIQDGIMPRSVTQEVRREIVKKRAISGIVDNDFGYPMVIQVVEPGDGPYDADMYHYWFVKFFDENGNEKELPDYLNDWIRGRFSVRNWKKDPS